MDDLGMGNNPAIEFAGGWLGIGFLAMIGAVIVGAALMAYGYGLGKIKAKSIGGGMALVALLGAVILGNVNGGIQWGTTEARTMSLMPKAAQKQKVTVEKEPPKVTCTSDIEYTISSTDGKDGPEHQAVYDILNSIVSDEDAQKIRDTPLLNKLTYKPQGPECSKENRVAVQCTKVTVHWTERKTKVRTGAQDFPKTDEYQSRGSKDC